MAELQGGRLPAALALNVITSIEAEHRQGLAMDSPMFLAFMDWVRGSSPDMALTCGSLQRIRATVNSQEQKRLLMDLDINMRTVDCFYTVTFYGALFREVRFVSAHLLPITAAIPL